MALTRLTLNQIIDGLGVNTTASASDIQSAIATIVANSATQTGLDDDSQVSIFGSLVVSELNATAGWNGTILGVPDGNGGISPIQDGARISTVKFDTSNTTAITNLLTSGLAYDNDHSDLVRVYVDDTGTASGFIWAERVSNQGGGYDYVLFIDKFLGAGDFDSYTVLYTTTTEYQRGLITYTFSSTGWQTEYTATDAWGATRVVGGEKAGCRGGFGIATVYQAEGNNAYVGLQGIYKTKEYDEESEEFVWSESQPVFLWGNALLAEEFGWTLPEGAQGMWNPEIFTSDNTVWSFGGSTVTYLDSTASGENTWNGVLMGAIASEAHYTPFADSQTVNGVIVDPTVLPVGCQTIGGYLDAFSAQTVLLDTDGSNNFISVAPEHIVVDGQDAGVKNHLQIAWEYPTGELDGNDEPITKIAIVFYANGGSATAEGVTFPEGWSYTLDFGVVAPTAFSQFPVEVLGAPLTVTEISPLFSGINGIICGAITGVTPPVPVDTITAGTYSSATGIWTDNADYTITDNGNGTYSVTGLIPYGRPDSLFAFAGYRFAVKISRDSITSRNDLPDGNICVVAVGNEVTQGTKDVFETDGSLIYIAAPVSDTLSTPRLVKIAWSMAGATLQESDFTTYTFDLSGAELAPIPVENEDESRVAYCITPKIPSDKFVKVVAPSGGLRAGQVVNCVALASSVEGVGLNLEVYSPSLPTTATLGSRFYALIVNGGFENLADGRRPDGNPDYTKYVYNEGDVCQAILLDKNLVFEISGSCISGDTSIDPTADIGRYIVPTNGTYVMSIANAPTDGGCLKIIGTTYFRRGGFLTEGHIPTYIALAIH